MKRYFIWADPNCNGINPEWKEISRKEFNDIKRDYPDRRFIPSFNEDDPSDDAFLFEATKEAYNEWNREHMNYVRHNYYFNRDYEVVSLDDLVNPDDSDGLTYAEIIPDTSDEDAENERIDNENKSALIANMMCEIEKLSEDDKKLIYAVFLNPNGNMSEIEYAKSIGISQQNVNKRKLKIFKNLRAAMGVKK